MQLLKVVFIMALTFGLGNGKTANKGISDSMLL